MNPMIQKTNMKTLMVHTLSLGLGLGVAGCFKQPFEASKLQETSAPQAAVEGQPREGVKLFDTSPKVSYKPFSGPVSSEQINTWVQAHQRSKGEQAGDYRYVYMTDALLADSARANYARVGIAKAINAVAPDNNDIVCPEEASDGHGIVFAVNLRSYWGNDYARKWGYVANAQVQQATGQTPILDLRRFDGNAPVSAPRFAYNLSHGGVYNLLIDSPSHNNVLKNQIGAKKITHRLMVEHAITFSPRYAQRVEIEGTNLAYWESYDDFDSNDSWNRVLNTFRQRSDGGPRFRSGGQTDGMFADWGDVASEAWRHLPNGLPAWYIWGNANQRRVRAETIFVVDPFNTRNRYLLTGNCQFCHIGGIQAAPSDIRRLMDKGELFQGQQLEQAKSIWSDRESLAEIYAKDKNVIREAYHKLTQCMSDGNKKFNEGIVYSSDREQIEPVFLLVSEISGHEGKGSTNGFRRRRINR